SRKMTNVPIDKPGATSPIKKDGKLRSFFGLKPKTKPENSKQTSPTQRASQITRTPLVTSQTNNRPSPPPPIIIRPRMNIFSENVPKPTIKSELPRLLERIEKTEQLLYCNSLLLQASSPSPKITSAGEEGSNSDSCDPLQEPTLDKTQLDWLAEMKKYPMEQDHTRGLASRMVEEFIKDAIKDSTKIAEVVALGPVLHKEHYRKLLSTFIKNFDEARILDVVLLQGLVQLVQSTSPGYLVPDDLVKILSILRVRLEGTHQQSTEHPYHLTLAVSRILDVMADYKVQDLGHVQEHEPLSGVLSGLKGSSDPYLMYQACYAFQALQYVPDDETVLQAVLRHSTGVFDGLVKVAGVVKLDLGSVLEGLGDLQETLGGTIETVGSVYEGVCSLMESGRGVMDSLKEGFGSGQKRPWYAALRAAYALAQAGQLKDLNQLICEAPCRRDPLFQWGICQLLGEIAVDSIWTVSVRLQAIDLLGELHKNDSDWRRDESVKEWMLTIIGHLANSSEQVVSEKAHSLLQNLQEDQDGAVKHPYPLRARLSVPASSPILARVQNIADVDYDLHRIRLQRLAEIDLPVYIPPMAKANLQAKDDDLFPLMDKVQEFLLSNRQVMLILGDSGAGKSTFNKHLESELWRSYKKGDRIPLFVNLPALDRPDRNLMMEQLKMHNFSDEQIREFKLQCKFVVICDGYDESKLAVNLHTFNLFNRPEQWNVKLVISCRSQYLSQDYRGRFVPQGGIRYDRLALELFQEAVMAPFSKEQIHNYVDQYVPLEPRKWCTQDYMDKLATIPNLMDLVKNPFLLTLALEALPGVIEGRQDLSNIRITRVQLYDTFVEHWFEVNKRRLEAGVFSREEHDILDQLLEAGFTSMGTEYSMRLSSAIFDKQDGNPVVQYVHLKDRASWKAEFFAPDPEIRFLRDSSPLARSGRLYRFLHRSILEYFFSRTIYTPCFESLDSDEFGPQADLDSTVTQSLDAEGPMFKRDLLVEPSVIQFLVERVQQHPEFEQLLLAVVELSKTDATASQAAANAFTILVRAGVRFNSADLQSIRIPWADLTEGQFDSAQFQGADLTGVTLTRSWIRQADFSNAQMDDIRLGELPYLEVERGINGCAYSPDGKMLAVALQKSDIVIYDTATWTKLHTLDAQLGLTFSSMAFSPDSEQIISGGGDGRASLWQLSMEEPLLVMEGHTKNLACVAFSPCGTQIALAGGDNTVRLWSLTTGEEDFVLDCQANSIINIAYSPTGHQFASIGWDKLVRLWNTETGEQEAPRVHLEHQHSGRWDDINWSYRFRD
ncbi:WD_REPEATS_REGION domain-containing protein, partial [Mortierella sp. GBA35]